MTLGDDMDSENEDNKQHRWRSDFIRRLVQKEFGLPPPSKWCAQSVPRQIVQFWHDLENLPEDVEECIRSWSHLETRGFGHHLFDTKKASTFIGSSLGRRYEHAFRRCYHPAMQSDYFRLCYLLVKGGLYVDADDFCLSSDIDSLFDDGRLKVQPLCYDIASGTMVSPSIFLRVGAYASDWIFYLNNNPLLAARGHPIVRKALANATWRLETVADEFPEIQSTTGPGNLSKSVFDLGTKGGGVENDMVILRDWEARAVSKWPLSYRRDARNWRNSNQQRFSGTDE